MHKKISRKTFLKNLSYASVGILNFSSFLKSAESGNIISKNIPLKNDPDGIISLINGFEYRILSKKNNVMSDGLRVPDHADGMASFKGNNGRIILIRNHEIGHFRILEDLLNYNTIHRETEFITKNINNFYDKGKNNKPAGGGTSTIIYNPYKNEVENEFMSLAGTLVNCSGGPTPWNTWISCEETVTLKGNGLLKNHGYNFEVKPSENIKLNKAIPLKDMGRFRHEAVAIDPKSNIAYQTEDRNDGLIYRFIPNSNQDYTKGGNLEALRFTFKNGVDTRNWNENKIALNKKYNTGWVPINQVDSDKDDLRYRGFKDGASIFARPEGMWYYNDFIYFTCTSGGRKQLGQIWKYNISENYIELIFESKNTNIMELCDNLTVSPWGDIIICEDGMGRDRLIGVRGDGTTYIIAENILNRSEFAGANFSPDGKILFVNIFSPTMTLAITGNWKSLQ